MKLSFVLTILAAFLVAGCAPPTPNIARMPEAKPVSKKASEPVTTKSFVRISSPKHQLLSARTEVNRRGVSIADALTAANGLKDIQIAVADPFVDLTRKINVRVSGVTVEDYLKHIGDITNYDYTIRMTGTTGIITVSSMIMKEWNLAAISNMPESRIQAGLSATISQGSGAFEGQNGGGSSGGGRSSGGGGSSSSDGSGTEIIITRDDDVWGDMLENAKEILGVDRITATPPVMPQDIMGSDGVLVPTNFNADAFEQTNIAVQESAWLVANKRMGNVTAFGRPNEIKRLDAWLSDIEHEINRQVHLDVAIMDITTTRGDGYGINWAAVYEDIGVSSSGLASAAASGTNVGGGALTLVDGGSWTFSAVGTIGAVTISALINALSEEGSVSMHSQPKVTVTNGYTAYLGATSEFSFVSNIDVVTTNNVIGGEPIVTTELSRVSVGLKLGVTPRLLPSGDILVEVVPVLSSIAGFTDVGPEGLVISTPNIAIQELATQVITQSGKPIHLGGLILSQIIENAQRMPLGSSETAKRVGELLGSVRVEESGKELLIVITPTEVGY